MLKLLVIKMESFRKSAFLMTFQTQTSKRALVSKKTEDVFSKPVKTQEAHLGLFSFSLMITSSS